MPAQPQSSRPVNGRAGSFRALRNREEAGGRVGGITDVPPEKWVHAIRMALSAGIGVTFSATSDGGAVSVTVYDGGERLRSYAASAEEFVELLEALGDHASAKVV